MWLTLYVANRVFSNEKKLGGVQKHRQAKIFILKTEKCFARLNGKLITGFI